jgi:hypothetical protein
MRVLKNLFGDGSKIYGDNIVIGTPSNHRTLTQGDWINADLQNGWTGTLRYRINAIGQIEMSADLIAGQVSDRTDVTQLPTRVATSGVFVLRIIDTNGLTGLLLYGGGLVRVSTNLPTIATGQNVVGNIVYLPT